MILSAGKVRGVLYSLDTTPRPEPPEKTYVHDPVDLRFADTDRASI